MQVLLARGKRSDGVSHNLMSYRFASVHSSVVCSESDLYCSELTNCLRCNCVITFIVSDDRRKLSDKLITLQLPAQYRGQLRILWNEGSAHECSSVCSQRILYV